MNPRRQTSEPANTAGGTGQLRRHAFASFDAARDSLHRVPNQLRERYLPAPTASLE